MVVILHYERFFFVPQTLCMKYAVTDTTLEFAGTLTKVKVFRNVIRIFVPTLSVEKIKVFRNVIRIFVPTLSVEKI